MTDDLRSDPLQEPPADDNGSQADTPAPEPDTPATPEPAPEPTPEPADEPSDEAPAEDFAAMLAADDARRESTKPDPKPGDRVTGKVVQLGDDDAFVDFGGRSELPISTADLKNADGELTVAVGDEITAFVTGKGADMRLAMKRKLTGKDPKPIQEALQSGLPLTGSVTETNKGGFVVDLGGWRAFCPISQIDDRFVEDPAVWVGRSLEFRVIEFAENGRRLVVSRRAILREVKDRLGAETRKQLVVGAVLEGKVVRILPFGAFVDLGGVEGLVHISELSHSRVEHPSDVVEEGQEVTVQVMDVQHLGRGRDERISLSLKAMQGDPWADIGQKFVMGEWYEGVVVGTTNFGAFVELMPGVNGLVHISAISSDPISHPDDVLTIGQQVSVRVVDIDTDRRRVSLSITR